MTGLKTQVSSQSRQDEIEPDALPTEAATAVTELKSVMQRGSAEDKAKPPLDGAKKRSSTAGLIISYGIVLCCIALIGNWFVQQFTNRMPAASQQPSFMQGSLLQGMQPGMMQGQQPNLMQSPQPNAMQALQPGSLGSALMPSRQFSTRYQVPAGLPPAGFSTRRLLAARSLHQPTSHHKTTHKPHSSKTLAAPAKKHGELFVPTMTYTK